MIHAQLAAEFNAASLLMLAVSAVAAVVLPIFIF